MPQDMDWFTALMATRGDAVLMGSMALISFTYLTSKLIERGLGEWFSAGVTYRREQARLAKLRADELESGRSVAESMDEMTERIERRMSTLERTFDDAVATLKDPSHDRRGRR